MHILNLLISNLAGIVVGAWAPPLIAIFLLGMFKPLASGNFDRINTLKYTISYALFLSFVELVSYKITGMSNYTSLLGTFALSTIFVVCMHISLMRSANADARAVKF